ncbi:MAG: UTP--glucose-1-phosphate uridylyltransferase GalU [Acidimicrobiia bacterium]|nr:UTP--glucose-1-phosphate uridylyltransferase GalU [Acidimicrobiia bacterium]
MTKAVIPAAGLGTRFLPATKAQPKEMLPVIDKPAIQYVVEEAVRAGIDDICIVTSSSKRSLEDHFDRNFELEHLLTSKGKDREKDDVVALAELADFHYVRQGEPLGLGHAVATARRHIGDSPFVVLLGDEFMAEGSGLLEGMIATHQEHGCSVLALMEVEGDEIARYGSADSEAFGDRLVKVNGVVEKPKPAEAPSNLAVMGRYVFTPQIFEHIARLTPGAGGELQLTDAIGTLLAEQQVLGFTFSEGRYDTGVVLDYLKVIVEMAAARPDIGPEFSAFLKDFVAKV